MIALVGGTLIDGNGGPPVSAATVVVEGKHIGAAGPSQSVAVPDDALRIDVRGKTVMPGLIDGHIHISDDFDPDPALRLGGLPELAGIRGVVAARRLLDAGFTSARALAGSGYTNVALKLAIDRGLVSGPRLVAAGPMIRAVGATGGTWAPPAPYPTAPDAVVNGPGEARRAVRLQHAYGVDIVEVTVSGLVGNSNGTTSMSTTSWRLDEMRAAVDEAHALGHRISANCYVDESVERCVQAGFDMIEHGCLITERGMRLLADSGTFIAPTLSAYHAYTTPDASSLYPAWQIASGRAVEAVLRERFADWARAGVRIVGGSDGALPGEGRRPGEGALELSLMVEYGLDPMAAIVAHTRTAAEAMGWADRVGTLTAGRLADLLVVDGDPLADVGILRHQAKLLVVMQGGVALRFTYPELQAARGDEVADREHRRLGC